MKFRRFGGARSFHLILYGLLATVYFGCSSGVPDDQNLEASAQSESVNGNQSQNGQENGSENSENKGEEQEVAENKDPALEDAEKSTQEASASEEKMKNSHENVAAHLEEKVPSSLEAKNNVVEAQAVPAAVSSEGHKIAQGEQSHGTMVSGIAGVAADSGLPELGSKMSYIVKRGDTLSKISAKVYGDSGKWKELAEYSNIKNPNKIFPGEIVYYQLSQESLAFAKEYENVSQEVVQVQTGDTLAKIAEKVYGSKYLWRYVWRQINADNPDKLEVGSKLYLKTNKSLENFEVSRNKGKVLGSKSLVKASSKVPV